METEKNKLWRDVVSVLAYVLFSMLSAGVGWLWNDTQGLHREMDDLRQQHTDLKARYESTTRETDRRFVEVLDQLKSINEKLDRALDHR